MPDLEGDWQNFDKKTELENKANRPKKNDRFKRPLVTIFGKSKLKRKKPTRKELEERAERKTQEEVKRLGNRISKLNRQDQIIMIMRKLHKKENKIILWLNATGVPKFRVLSKDEVLAPYPLREPENEKKFSKVKIISDIIVKIANFVDPSLHINIKYPNHCCYLYNYDKKIIPDVIRIPRKVCQSKCHVTAAVSYSDYKSDEKSSIYIFSDKYLSDVKDLSVVQNIKNQTDEQLRQTAESLRKKLEQHIRLLHLPLNVFDEKFPDEFFGGTERDSFENTKPKNSDFNSTNIKEKTATPRKKPGYFPRNMGNDENFGGELRKSLRINCPEYKLRLERFKEIKNNLDLSVRDMEYLKNLLKSEQNLELRKSVQMRTNAKKHSMTKEDGRKRKISGPTQSLKKSQRIRAKQNHDFIVTLDGTVDSSSSDEEKMGAKRKRTARTPSRDSQRYRALPISINKSPKTEGLPKSSDKCGVSLNTHNLLKEETPMTQKATVNTVCDLNVKRQLFSNDSCLNSTIVEEKIVCSYAPVHRKIDILKDISNENCFEGKPGSGTIFSSDSDSNCDQEFLTAAEKYDKETDYLAKEGSSRYLTQELSGTTPRDAYPSSGNSSSGQITPYQRFGSANMYAIPEESPNEGTGTDTFPKVGHLATNRAPTRRDVIISLDKYGIALVEQKQPFYSNLEDVTGSIEVGFNVLKINSTTTEHMAEFESQTDALNNFRKTSLDDMSLQWKTTNIKNVILSFCKDRECIITPVRKPPTSKMILQWTKENTRRNVKEEKPIERVKIHLPSSPRSKEEDFEMSLTLTPCSPGSQSSSSQNTLQNTPKSSKTSGESDSPIFDKQCKARKKEILEKSFRKSLFRSQESSISHSCQITGVTENNSFDKSAQNLQNARAVLEHRNLTVLVLEVHVRTRGDFKPDPSHDSIRAVFYSILHDIPEPNLKGNKCNGVIAINELPPSPGVTKVPILNGLGFDCDVTYVDSEENLFDGFLKIIAYWDPDIFAGYEIELLSWGYLIERASILGINMKPLLGRTKINSLRWKDEDSPNELKITGRIVLDVWRLMRHEIALQSYTFESIVFHILHKRVPYYSFRELSFWWDHRSNLYRHRTVLYYLTRGMAVLELFDKLDFLGRTSELARLFGIQFYEVLSRGTQFRVESMMLRLAKPLNFIPVSPSVQQRASMNAPEYIALVLEPESKLYNDPVIVLDFQSLYPSIIIAYNYCFTTCIGKVQNLGKSGPFEFGATQLKIPEKLYGNLLRETC
ncbi:hypothetical protein JTB14_018199 [Gonioctena quinquepunctata]|nr:hypothetical protein JTB14_018199 [Gonioctena quinquepunctata]